MLLGKAQLGTKQHVLKFENERVESQLDEMRNELRAVKLEYKNQACSDSQYRVMH